MTSYHDHAIHPPIFLLTTFFFFRPPLTKQGLAHEPLLLFISMMKKKKKQTLFCGSTHDHGYLPGIKINADICTRYYHRQAPIHPAFQT